MEDLVRHFGLGVYVEPDSSDAVADGMVTLLHGKLPEPDWEGYEAHATWETNVTRLLQATADHLNGKSPRERQFEKMEEEGVEIPELLNARRLRHQKSTPLKKKVAAAKKTVAGKKLTPSRKEKPLAEAVNGHAAGGELDVHPVFPGFDLAGSAVVPPSQEPRGKKESKVLAREKSPTRRRRASATKPVSAD